METLFTFKYKRVTLENKKLSVETYNIQAPNVTIARQRMLELLNGWNARGSGLWQFYVDNWG